MTKVEMAKRFPFSNVQSELMKWLVRNLHVSIEYIQMAKSFQHQMLKGIWHSRRNGFGVDHSCLFYVSSSFFRTIQLYA